MLFLFTALNLAEREGGLISISSFVGVIIFLLIKLKANLSLFLFIGIYLETAL